MRLEKGLLALVQSLIIHMGSVALLFLFKMSFNFYQAKQVELMPSYIKSSIRVDILELPKNTLKELRAITPDQIAKTATPPTKSQKKEEEEIVESEKKVSSLDEFLKEASAKKIKDHSKLKNVSKGKKAKEDQLQKVILAGNKLSEGAQIENASLSENLTKMSLYAERVVMEVRKHWELPSFLQGRNLKCRVRLYLSSRGDLINVELVNKSDDSEFDKRALQAVKKAAPFEVPSSEIEKSLNQGQLILGFPI